MAPSYLDEYEPCPFCGARAQRHRTQPNNYVTFVHTGNCFLKYKNSGYSSISVPRKNYSLSTFTGWNHRGDENAVKSVEIYNPKPEIWVVTIAAKNWALEGCREDGNLIRKYFIRESLADAFISRHNTKLSPQQIKETLIFKGKVNIEGDPEDESV